MLYVVGAPQTQHLAMVFADRAARRLARRRRAAEHVAFGSVLGPDKKMLKTRAGDSVRLADLLDEAVERAARGRRGEVARPRPGDAGRASPRAVGIGAVKYADLSSDRVKDYVFDWDRMLALDGNTAPYLQYAHARIRSIFRKGGASEERGRRGRRSGSRSPPSAPSRSSCSSSRASSSGRRRRSSRIGSAATSTPSRPRS